MNQPLLNIIKWLSIYLIALTTLILVVMWYAPKFIEALWLASEVIG